MVTAEAEYKEGIVFRQRPTKLPNCWFLINQELWRSFPGLHTYSLSFKSTPRIRESRELEGAPGPPATDLLSEHLLVSDTSWTFSLLSACEDVELSPLHLEQVSPSAEVFSLKQLSGGLKTVTCHFCACVLGHVCNLQLMQRLSPNGVIDSLLKRRF